MQTISSLTSYLRNITFIQKIKKLTFDEKNDIVIKTSLAAVATGLISSRFFRETQTITLILLTSSVISYSLIKRYLKAVEKREHSDSFKEATKDIAKLKKSAPKEFKAKKADIKKNYPEQIKECRKDVKGIQEEIADLTKKIKRLIGKRKELKEFLERKPTSLIKEKQDKEIKKKEEKKEELTKEEKGLKESSEAIEKKKESKREVLEEIEISLKEAKDRLKKLQEDKAFKAQLAGMRPRRKKKKFKINNSPSIE